MTNSQGTLALSDKKYPMVENCGSMRSNLVDSRNSYREKKGSMIHHFSTKAWIDIQVFVFF